MAAPLKPKFQFVAVADIEIGERLRPADATAVEAIIQSAAERGILKPIQVNQVKGSYRLLDGLHRLSAAISLGMPEVPAMVHRCSVREGMNIEVEANIAQAPMTPLDMGVFLARQKELYEEEHPETKRGAYDRSGVPEGITGETPVMSFVANAARALGKDETTVRRVIAAAKSLSKPEIQQLRSAPNRVTLEDLQQIAKCDTPTDRAAICTGLATGKVKSAKAVLAELHKKPGKVEKPKKEVLSDAWARASKAQKRAFVETHAEEIEDLLSSPRGSAEVVTFKARERSAS